MVLDITAAQGAMTGNATKRASVTAARPEGGPGVDLPAIGPRLVGLEDFLELGNLGY